MARTTTRHHELTRPLYATVGVTDRAVELVRGSVSDLQARLVELQQSINKLEREPQQLRNRAVSTVNGQADALAREARQRRAAIETRVAELQARALQVPDQVQGFLEEHELAYDQLVTRGDALVRRIRRQQATQDAVKAARTTSSKAKTTKTQAGKAGRSTAKTAQGAAKNAAKSTSSTARKQSKAPQSSAKATATGAKKTAKSTAKATADASKKVGS
jgi:hypothetical protein